jgi:NAD(P)-dependent dehydrogenase (short-subunit alcohol dehydrogenase family)
VAVEGFDLTGKRALVVGAETRVGRVIAAALAEAGARLALASGADVHGPGDDALLSSNGSENGSGNDSGHLTISGTADDLVRVTLEELGGLDVVVNCADLRVAGPFEQLTDAAWDRLLVVNLSGPVRLFRAAGREMKARGGGKLIQVVSMLGERGVPNTAAYGATQAGLLQLIRALSLEWARSSIRVNGIGLGWLEGDPMLGPSPDRLLRYLPTKRLGRPDEVGPLAVYLASDDSDMMTGQTLWVDGAVMSHA